MPFPLLTAILRIGKKYQIEHFQAEGLERLRSEFPRDLDAWDVSVANLVFLEEVEDSLENLPGAYVSYLSLVNMVRMYGQIFLAPYQSSSPRTR